MIASILPRERSCAREREMGSLKDAGKGGPCSSCQTRVMDTSHCGKLTNTPWRPSDNTRVRMRACNLHADLVHVHVSVLSPTRDKHERVYAGSLPRERNEMKRLHHRAVPVQRSIPHFLASNHCSILRSAHAGACVTDAGPTSK